MHCTIFKFSKAFPTCLGYYGHWKKYGKYSNLSLSFLFKSHHIFYSLIQTDCNESVNQSFFAVQKCFNTFHGWRLNHHPLKEDKVEFKKHTFHRIVKLEIILSVSWLPCLQSQRQHLFSPTSVPVDCTVNQRRSVPTYVCIYIGHPFPGI